MHKIGILDARILNLDRNDCNILVQQNDPCSNSLTLIPIDHGLSIPDTLAVCSYDIVWMSFPQTEEPFSAKSLAYIKALDVVADVRMLEKTLNFRPICLRNMRIAGTLLQLGACEFNLTLA